MNLEYPEIILELANFHEGKLKKIKESINFYNKLSYQKKSIKFQVFKYSEIATKNYTWFKIYQKLFISKSEWSKLFKLVNNKKIWIDVFDNYSLEVIKENQKLIYGIKLQSSILENQNLIQKLLKMDLTGKNLLLNISGVPKKKILYFKKIFSKKKIKKTIFQFGFQSYPTQLNEINLNKIDFLKKNKIKNFSYADHTDANDNFSKILPSVLFAKGYQTIEKHFCLNRKKTKYDFYSSLEPNEFEEMLQNIKSYILLMKKKPFIHDKEKKYLRNSVQKLVLTNNKYKGNAIEHSDFKFKRTPQKGLKLSEIKKIINNTPILKRNIFSDDQVKKNNFKKKNKIGIFVICRMKSTRLKNKALLKLGNKETIVHVIDKCLEINGVNQVFLATSYLKEDLPLVKFLKKKYKKRIKYILGDPDDVLQRMIVGCNKYSLDTAIRVTGDCPVISPEIIEFLIKNHIKNNSDMTCANNFAVGTAGEIYSAGSLEHILLKTKKARYSEYLPFYYFNNEKYFKITKCHLPKKFIGKYRLTIDYNEDFVFFNKLFEKLNLMNMPPNLINIFKILKNNKNIYRINKDMKLIYKQNNFVKSLNKKTKFN